MKITKYLSDTGLYHFGLKQFKMVVSTAGDGFWSNDIRKVSHSKAQLCIWDEQLEDFLFNKLKFAELRVFFPKRSWDVNKHGLIYTDTHWIKNFRLALLGMGFSARAVKSVHYTEQGMQGDNYVSLDVGLPFIKQVREKLSL